jgi:phytoene/squalene synthetase
LKLSGPWAVRYPRDTVPDELGAAPPFVLGKCRVLREGPDATILAYGSLVPTALEAAQRLASEDIFVSVVNARFAKPIDEDMVTTAVTRGAPVVTVEEHSVTGGFGSAVLETANRLGLATDGIIRLGMAPERFYEHGARSGQLAEAGLDAMGIAATVRRAVQAVRSAGSWRRRRRPSERRACGVRRSPGRLGRDTAQRKHAAVDAFVARHLQGVSRTYAILVPMLPPPLADAVGLAYLVMRIVDTVEDDPQLTADERRRYFAVLAAALGGDAAAAQTLAQPLGDNDDERALMVDAPEVLARVRALPMEQRTALADCARAMMVGVQTLMARSAARGVPYPAVCDVTELREYCYYVAGVVGEMLCALMAGYLRQPGLLERRAEAVELGTGLQLVNILKDARDDAEHGRRYLPIVADGAAAARVYQRCWEERGGACSGASRTGWRCQRRSARCVRSAGCRSRGGP